MRGGDQVLRADCGSEQNENHYGASPDVQNGVRKVRSRRWERLSHYRKSLVTKNDRESVRLYDNYRHWLGVAAERLPIEHEIHMMAVHP